MPEASFAHMERGWLTEHLDAYTETTRSRLLQGQTIHAVDYLRAQQQRRAFSSNLRSSMQGIHALVLPTLPMPAILIEQADTDILIDGVTENATVALLRMTMPYNLAGLPAISLPCGFSSGGLPIGLQIVGKPFEESMILRIAHAYQQLTDWHRREISLASKYE
jgi:aspartyl-tRNA(Asn)/glutamyl-tRNA(Gln) amidotransferase subunit A